ncbi:OapA family protein [Aliamphritea spongicola]|uniref:OapA family protein n=1 Tax=Aliamphritea spongicola TaxID=707589 RepID=UPI00196A92E3|nr:peptidoglycan DD-metalloendopeptidase family protein [Aliamphritea spongicola]MBN3564216.1 peptidoglycan DD-metalloendopeptidase family protein [Aliamphritea spongicola]
MGTVRHIAKFFPTTHLAAVAICTLVIGTTLIFLPESNAQQTQTLPVTINEDTASTVTDILEENDIAVTTAQTELQLALAETAAKPPAAGSDKKETEAPQPERMVVEAVPLEDEWQDFKVSNGDSLSGIFIKAGLTATDVYRVTNAVKESKALSRIYPGQTLSFLIKDDQLVQLRHIKSQLDTAVITKTEDGYVLEEVTRKPETLQRFVTGTINNSLFLDAQQAGLSNRMIMELAAIFGWDIDFALDIRKGDSFSIVYEEKFLDGKMIGEGNILSAQFTNRGDTFTALRFTDSKGKSSYYTPDGKSMRKAFLRTPIDFARISSRFNLKRKHPVLKTTRPHRGTDYAARTGTPIKTSGDGKIIWRGKKGGYGNTIIVQHGGNITTLYAHMSKFKKGQKVGSRVKQGQIIGYVGSTGLSSGPHLHYEFRVNGVHKNSQTVKLPQANPVPKSERKLFDEVSADVIAKLETYKATQLASTAN